MAVTEQDFKRTYRKATVDAVRATVRADGVSVLVVAVRADDRTAHLRLLLSPLFS